jgi:hypothetical protein
MTISSGEGVLEVASVEIFDRDRRRSAGSCTKLITSGVSH